MKPSFVLPLAVAACLPFASPSHAVVYNEVGDAGEYIGAGGFPQVVGGTPGTPLTGINGQLTLTNGISDCDLYQIYISDPSSFSASMTAFVPGANNFDSQLSVFNLAGRGIETNDDDAAMNSSESNLPSGSMLMSSQAAGLYYLLVSGSGRYAVDGTGNLIFPNYTDGTTDPTGVYGPNANAGTFTTYTGNSSEAGVYNITLTGAQVVPEPSPGWFMLAGAAGVAVLQRTRRRTAK